MKTVTDFISVTPFQDIRVLRSDYIPSDIEYRSDELDKLAGDVFAAPANSQVPENLFVYGQPGTGKTLCVKYWLDQVDSMDGDHYNDSKFLYLNCKRFSSPSRLIHKLSDELSDEDVKMKKGIDYYMDIVTDAVEGNKVIVILDEIDRVLESNATITGDDILYNLLRAREDGNLNDGYISVVGISNKMNIKEKMSQGTVSSFGNNWMSFDPYNKQQIKGILEDRAEKGIKNFDGLGKVIDDIAAHVAKLDGDARTAINILRHAGKIAEKDERPEITIDDVGRANYMVQKENIMEDVKHMTEAQKLAYLALLIVHYNDDRGTRVNVKKAYKQLIDEKDISVPDLSRKQISNYLKEMAKRDLLDRKVLVDEQGRPTVYIPSVSGKVLRMLGKELLKDFEEEDSFSDYFNGDEYDE